jgi:hypothetical protein
MSLQQIGIRRSAMVRNCIRRHEKLEISCGFVEVGEAQRVYVLSKDGGWAVKEE